MGQVEELVERPAGGPARFGDDLIEAFRRYRAFLVLYVVVSAVLVIVLGMFHDARLAEDDERPSSPDAPAGTAE